MFRILNRSEQICFHLCVEISNIFGWIATTAMMMLASNLIRADEVVHNRYDYDWQFLLFLSNAYFALLTNVTRGWSKICPNYYKVAEKVASSSFHLNLMFLKIAQTVTKYLVHYCNKVSCQKLKNRPIWSHCSWHLVSPRRKATRVRIRKGEPPLSVTDMKHRELK